MAWISIKIREERYRRIAELAAADRRSISSMLEILIDRSLGDPAPPVNGALAGREPQASETPSASPAAERQTPAAVLSEPRSGARSPAASRPASAHDLATPARPLPRGEQAKAKR